MKQNDIVQITKEDHRWYPCLVIVSEVKGFGIQGYITIPSNDDKQNGNAYIRLNTGDFERVGKAVLVPGSEEEDGEK